MILLPIFFFMPGSRSFKSILQTSTTIKWNGCPENYNETNVAYEIPPISDADGDGNVEECFEKNKPVLVRGDNHCGYIGFREPFFPSLIDDGAMDVLVRDWIKP